MSYILDALQKSEAERRRGEVPDLNRPLQMAQGPKRKRGLGMLWLAVALLVNALVLGVIFWPGTDTLISTSPGSESHTPVAPRSDAPAAQETSGGAAPSQPVDTAVVTAPQIPDEPAPEPDTVPAPQATEAASASSEQTASADNDAAPSGDKPTLIVPSASPGNGGSGSGWQSSGRVPSLNEMPLAFQRGIPDLRFSSHVYASDPGARRVMINGHYLRPGDRFSGVRVEGITENGVVLFADGERFRVGVVRNWSSPE